MMDTDTDRKKLLQECESVIQSHRDQWPKVAEMFARIQEEKLFEADGYNNFQGYVNVKWGYAKAYGYQMAAFGRCRQLLRTELAQLDGVDESAIADDELPATEGQARPLSLFKNEPAKMCEIWEATKLEHNTKQPTKEKLEETIKSLNLSKKSDSKPLTNEMRIYKRLLIDCGQPEEELTNEYMHSLFSDRKFDKSSRLAVN